MTTAPSEVAGSTGSPAADAPHVRRGLALALLAGAQLMIVLDATIVNIALPDMGNALHISETSISWVLNAYMLTFGGLLLLGGRFGDLFGRRRLLALGLIVFTVASLLGGFATNEGLLLAARALQGVGGAMVAPAVLSLVTTTFEEGPERNKAFGVYAAVSGMGSAVGLLAGGLLTEYLSWRWVMFVNVPIGIALVAALPLAIPDDAKTGEKAVWRGRLDIPGALTSTLGVTALVYGVIRAAEKGWGDGLTIGSLIASAVLIAGFVAIELRVDQPLMPMRLFRNRNRSASYVVMALAAGGMMGAFLFITLYMQIVAGYSPVKAGLAYLPLCAGVMISAQFTSVMLPKIGPRILLTVGPVLAAVGLFYLSLLEADSGYVSGLLPAMLVFGLGMGLIFVAIMSTAVAGIAPEDAGIGSAMLNVTQQIGGAVAIAVLTTIYSNAFDTELKHQVTKFGEKANVNVALTEGYTTAFLVASILLAVGAIVAVAILRVSKSDLPAESTGALH
ncbi:MFS transporter [Streptomyces sp. SID3343]|uniref:MFS transporter n=1 Tax=Streptomyces sp. SID3343 TaxID=2690260 RepID=UPI00136C372D|nr:MFS transporter [Streptomyces sp. SID3343]MYV97917.1 DHA2 family efflux MFS transporter permease subunit [Streptomyces sp. SID3343]